MKSKRLFPLFLMILFAVGCGPKPETSQSVLDTPDYHVSQGMKLLDKGDIDGAESSFQRALGLDKKYAEGYSGMALVEAARGNFEEARDQADEGVARGKKNPITWAVRGRVKSLQMDGDDWIDKADRDFRIANDMDPENDLIFYWWGLAQAQAYQFREASDYLSHAIELNGMWSASADRELARIQKILRSAPGTRVGSRIALLNKIDRADLAVLFMEELKLAEVIDRTRPKEVDNTFQPPEDPTNYYVEQSGGDDLPVDVRDHYAKTWIREIIDLGIMEVSPDNRFYPDTPVTRAEFALFLQNILIDVMHDPSLATKYIGESSRFSDMRSGMATYNAAALAVDRGIMEPRIDGTFGATDPVSGADALLIIRSFQNYLKINF